MSPLEFHHAIQSKGELQRMQNQHDYEVARYHAIAVINMTSTILKDRIRDPKEVLPLPWDVKVQKKQTIEEMKKAAQALVAAFGGVKADKGPDDPPRILAPKFRK